MKEIFKQKYIFVVDDTAFMRASLVKLLIEIGFDRDKIKQFENGQAALDAVNAESKLDLIFSDWNMPLMTGVELLKAIRSGKHAHSDIPIVMITTVSEKEKVIEALKFKLSGYIIKPIQEDKLLETVENIFGDGLNDD